MIIILLAEGESELGFCDCNICNQGYREIVAALKNASGKRRLTANSREVVKEVHGKDITKYKVNFFEMLRKLDNDRLGKVKAKDPSGKENRKIITINIEESVFEKILMKILSTEKGQRLLKDVLDN